MPWQVALDSRWDGALQIEYHGREEDSRLFYYNHSRFIFAVEKC
jgi:hypothetical protein